MPPPRIARPTTARAWPRTSKTQIEVPVTRNYGDMRVDVVGPVVSRVFNPNNAIADRMKHVDRAVVFGAAADRIANQDRIPTATGYDIIIGGVTQMSYGLTNRLLVRKDKEGEPQAGAPREMLNVSMRQSYYTDENASKFDTVVSVRLQQPRGERVLADRALARAMPIVAAGDRLSRSIRPAGRR